MEWKEMAVKKFVLESFVGCRVVEKLGVELFSRSRVCLAIEIVTC